MVKQGIYNHNDMSQRAHKRLYNVYDCV